MYDITFEEAYNDLAAGKAEAAEDISAIWDSAVAGAKAGDELWRIYRRIRKNYGEWYGPADARQIICGIKRDRARVAAERRRFYDANEAAARDAEFMSYDEFRQHWGEAA